MNKYELLKEIHDNDVYKDDMSIVAYNSKGELTDKVRVIRTMGVNGTRLAIIGEDE